MKKNFAMIGLLIIIIGLSIWYTSSRKKISLLPLPSLPTLISKVNYTCKDNKTIDASFYKEKDNLVKPGQSPTPSGSVKLILSDGRNFNLSQTISADGGRYANSDESIIFWNKGENAFINEEGEETFEHCVEINSSAKLLQTANPASVNCTKVGGNLVMMKNSTGGEYGLCYFEDNKACEEWALLRGECPFGGVKITGFDTIDQKFCAWSGGKTYAQLNSVCTFNNGTQCSTIDFYNGECSADQI